MKREGLLYPGAFVTLSWTRNGKPNGEIRARVEERRVILIYSTRLTGQEEWKAVEELINLVSTPCNYGGSRPWFICPGFVNGRYCGRRVAILYLAGRYFLCRHCHDLTYESRNESEAFRFLSKAQKILKRLGASPRTDVPIWRKPKGMHWKTFSDLAMQAYKAGRMALLDASKQFGLIRDLE